VHSGDRTNDSLWRILVDELADRLAERLAPRLAQLIAPEPAPSTPWLTTAQAVAYTRLPEGTFRKLAASGKIPSHGGRSKVFYRPELDEALLAFSGIAEESRTMASMR
jgi:Helix-turn-helix domain